MRGNSAMVSMGMNIRGMGIGLSGRGQNCSNEEGKGEWGQRDEMKMLCRCEQSRKTAQKMQCVPAPAASSSSRAFRWS